MLIARLAPECEHPAARHVERRYIGHRRRKVEKQPVVSGMMLMSCPEARRRRVGENHVLGIEAGKEGRAGYGQYGDAEGYGGYGDFAYQPPILGQFLLMVGGVDHAA